MKCLIKHSTRHGYDLDELKLETLGSPKLVSAFLSNDTAKKIALTNVKSKYMKDLLSWKRKMYVKKKETLMSIYYMQRINERLSEADEENFGKSLVAHLKILFIDEDNTILCTCFYVYHLIMDFLVESAVEVGGYNELEFRFANAVKGSRFEYLFYEGVQKIDLSILKARQKNARNISIDVTDRTVISPGSTLSALESGKLYMLQPCHPSIDAVVCQDSIVYLIQLSTMLYKDHGTKVDSVNMAFRKSSVLDFYKRCSGCRHAAYIYLTTSDSPSLRHLENSILGLSYVGIVTPDSDLCKFIAHCSERIRSPITFK